MSLMGDDEIDAWWRTRELEASKRLRRAARVEACPQCNATVGATDKRCWNCNTNLCKGCGQ